MGGLQKALITGKIVAMAAMNPSIMNSSVVIRQLQQWALWASLSKCKDEKEDIPRVTFS